MTEEEKFQLYLHESAEKLANTIEVNIEFYPLKSKLDQIESFMGTID